MPGMPLRALMNIETQEHQALDTAAAELFDKADRLLTTGTVRRVITLHVESAARDRLGVNHGG